MTEYYMVDVKSITSKIPRSKFNVNELDNLAKSIVSAGGLLSPLLLKQTGAETYEVVAGDFEYYASVRAKDLFPRKAEMVNAFVLSEEMTAEAIEQCKLLHRSVQYSVPEFSTKKSTSRNDQLVNLEARLDEFMLDFKQMRQKDMKNIEEGIETLREQLPSQVEALESFNQDSVPDLMRKMARANIKGKTAEKIIKGVEKARQKKAFTSFKDVVSRVSGLGETRMLTILDSWGGMY